MIGGVGAPTSGAVAEIDHLLTYVANIDAAAAVYRKLGFTLTPQSRIEPMGIVNQLVLMTPKTRGAANFIELMSNFDRKQLPPSMADLLSGEERTRSMVMMTPDAARSHAALVSLGYPFPPPIRVKREWRLSETEAVFPEFDVLLPVDAPLVFNACQYHNVDLYLRAAWRTHANTAMSLETVTAVADDVESIANQYASLFDCGVDKQDLDEMSVRPAGVTLEIMTSDRFASRFEARPPPLPNGRGAAYAGFSVQVADTETCRSCLRENGVEFSEVNGGLFVTACGNLVGFRGV